MKLKTLSFGVLALILVAASSALTESNTDGPVPTYINRYLTDDGTTQGAHNANGNYAVTGGEFYIQPPNGTIYRLFRLLISIGDANIASSDTYGQVTALSNGVGFWTEINGVRSYLHDNRTVKTNGDYNEFMYDFNCDSLSLGQGTDYCSGRWTFDKAGTVIRLNGTTGDKFIVTVNDTLTGLVHHHFIVQGYEELDGTTTVESLESIQGDTQMIAIALLLIGIIFFPIYVSSTLQSKDDQGKVLPLVTMVKLLLYAFSGFVVFFAVQMIYGISLANSLAAAINVNVRVIYQFTISILYIILFVVFMGLLINSAWYLIGRFDTAFKRKTIK